MSNVYPVVRNFHDMTGVKVVRIHCDNMRCVYAYNQLGCRSMFLNRIIKYLYDWQIKNCIRLEIVYVNTKDNLADSPSRVIDIDDEMCVQPQFFQRIEATYRIRITLGIIYENLTILMITLIYKIHVPALEPKLSDLMDFQSLTVVVIMMVVTSI